MVPVISSYHCIDYRNKYRVFNRFSKFPFPIHPCMLRMLIPDPRTTHLSSPSQCPPVLGALVSTASVVGTANVGSENDGRVKLGKLTEVGTVMTVSMVKVAT